VSEQPRGGAAGAVADISRSLISALPPAFLMLCVLNAAFLGGTLWFLSNQMEKRTEIVSKMLDRCMEQRK
jgi:hypothetical protein